MSSKYHLRFHCDSTNVEDICKKYVKMCKPSKYIFCAEYSKTERFHVHAELEYGRDLTDSDKVSRSRFYKKYTDDTVKAYHAEVMKASNILYILKDGKIVLHNWPLDELQQKQSETQEINEDKHVDIKIKLINEVKKQLPNFKKTRQIYDAEEETYSTEEYYDIMLCDIVEIIFNTYVDKYDKLPPNNSLMFQYKLYIARKLNVCETEIKLAYKN